MLTKPYLKPGGFSEPVVTMKKLFNSTQTKQTSNTITTLRSKSSLIPKNSEKGSNNFSFEYLNHHIGFMEKPSNLKKSSSKTQIKEKDYGQSENSMIYSIRPDYSKKVLMHSHINQSEYCTERNEKPKHVYGNLSVDNRQKKQQSLNKKLSHKIMEIDQINNNENNYYKENIGLRGYFFLKQYINTQTPNSYS